MLTARAPAKVNLWLYVTGKRNDGYHLLDTYVVFPDIYDEFRFESSELLTLHVTGEFASDAGSGSDNLVLGAARALNAAAGTSHGARITLTKHIPVGAGLGGGSADAAAALKALNAFWQLGLTFEHLIAIGSTLGADVPMCLHSRPLIGHGIGDVIALIDKDPMQAWMVLVHPRVVLATKDVFANISEDVYARAIFNHYPSPESHVSTWWNDLQESAITLCPQVADVIAALADRALPGGQAVRMTGSGAGCFALFFEQAHAQHCAHKMRNDFPQWWVQLTKVWL